MTDMSVSGEKDPYMQAYITARMKNQVEEMKLQKTLSTMEVSQRIRKIMINLELYEDRKMAHKFKQEQLNVANRQRQAMNRYVRSRGARSLGTWTAKSGTTWMGRSDFTASHGAGSSTAGDLNHHPTHAHPLGHPATAPPTGKRAVYPVTEGKDYGLGENKETNREVLPIMKRHALTAGAGSREVPAAAVPVIEISDYSEDKTQEQRSGDAAQAVERHCEGLDPEAARAAAAAVAAATITEAAGTAGVHKHTVTYASDINVDSHPTHASPTQAPADTAKSRAESEPAGVYFPPVPRPRRTQSQRTITARTGTSQPEFKRVTSAGMWPGDPKAIRSVRRDRRNVDEMLATMKAGEETRRLIRETTRTCSRNCNKPNILTLMERTYVNLPDLLPEIEKARQRMAEQEAAERDLPPDFRQSTSAKRRNTGRFDIDEEAAEGGKNLPIYHIQYTALREMGGTRRNSVFA